MCLSGFGTVKHIPWRQRTAGAQFCGSACGNTGLSGAGGVKEAAVGPKFLQMAGFCSGWSLLTGQLFLLPSALVVSVARVMVLCRASETWNQLSGFSNIKAVSVASAKWVTIISDGTTLRWLVGNGWTEGVNIQSVLTWIEFSSFLCMEQENEGDCWTQSA